MHRSDRGRPRSALSRAPAIWRSRATLLVALLALTLVIAAVLAWEAHAAARSHRATTERALHDYATFAAWELLANATDNLQLALGAAFAPVTGVRAGTPYEALPAPDILAAGAAGLLPCADARADAHRWYYRVDFRDGSVATAGSVPSAAERAATVAVVSEQARTVYRPDWRYAMVLPARGADAGRALVYAVKYAEHGAPIAAFGLSACASALGAPIFARVMERHALLPRTLTGGAPNDSLVSVTVFGPGSDTLFQSAERGPSLFTADVTVETVGGLTARASLRPLAIERLALGAIPRSKLPLLLGLLGLTAAMMAVALLQLRREQDLARLRSDFISGVSHELRTPLSQILLFAETLQLGRVRSEEERAGATAVIVQESRRLMQLVENVLHFARAERRMARLAPAVMPLAPCLRETIEAWRPLAAAADVAIDAALDERVVACVDRGALRQMLLNLLDNAVKYGPPGQTVHVRLERDGGHARLSVTDEGPGIPRESRARVWEPFYRLDRDTDSAVAGSGIGLFVVRELAALQQGTVGIEDAAGRGTRVVVELNAIDRESPAPAPESGTRAAVAAGVPR